MKDFKAGYEEGKNRSGPHTLELLSKILPNKKPYERKDCFYSITEDKDPIFVK